MVYFTQEQIEELRKKESRIDRDNAELSSRNRKLDNELSKTQRECEQLRRALENHRRDVKALKVTQVPSTKSPCLDCKGRIKEDTEIAIRCEAEC